MKKGWKIALATVAAAIVGSIPYSHKKDEETGASVTQALLWSCAKKPNGDKQIVIGLHLGSVPLPEAEEDCTESCPEECLGECIETCAEEIEEAEEAEEAPEAPVEAL